MTQDLRHRTALIIGASRGLGLGLAQELAGRGWTVVATARDLARSPDLAALAAAHAGAMELGQVDITDVDSVERFAATLGERPLDLAFINAGVLGPQHQSTEAATPDEIGALFHTNATAPIRIARRLAPRLRRPGGSLAFMSSRMGSVADNESGGLDLYRASKAALNSLTRGLAASLGPEMSVLNLHPGWVRTEMGGEDAPLDVATSVHGLADVIEERLGQPGHAFVDYRGQLVPW